MQEKWPMKRDLVLIVLSIATIIGLFIFALSE